ncbi:pheromone A receptor-domain-containing protein [Pisolithus croceorrhizus]|nr:pheromone A receptor-domain-containing protein [Pisolithus croceorrhizus]KAI6163951.1 pheromone A receptor-domain-containing protein [Pisolithus thermaeus]
MDANPTYPLFPVSAFLGFIVVLIPLPWHLQAWNSGTCMYIAWTALGCLLHFVNSVVWRNNALNVAPVWCDISTKLFIGAGVGIPAAGLCISRRLYKIAVIKSVAVTREDKRRAVIVDLTIAIGIPVVVMALHYVVQGHRFDILEDVGCWPSIYNTLPAYFLVFMWPTLLGCISFIFSALNLRAFYRRRLEFNQLLTSNSSMNVGQYIRLMALACIEMSSTIPICIANLCISNEAVPIQPWISWENVHYNFSHVGLYPAVIWQSNSKYVASVEMTRWLFPACGFLFFALFGFAAEARKQYRAMFLSIVKFLGYKPTQETCRGLPGWKCSLSKSMGDASSALPAYVTSFPLHAEREASFAPSSKGYKTASDLEKAISCSSPTLPRYSGERDVSPTATDFSQFDDSTTQGDVEAKYSSSPDSVDIDGIPPSHRPFTSPSILPVGVIDARMSHCLDAGISVSVQTQYAIAL